jgi:DNA-binding transcriptional regulator YhcF (GntR family)
MEGSVPIPPVGLIKFQEYLQFKAPIAVVVPFANKLVNSMSKRCTNPRIQRDFEKLLSLIKAVSILRQHHRECDSDGRIIAKLEDYATVRELANELYVETTGASDDIRSLVEAVVALSKKQQEITGTKLAEHLGVNKMTISRRARKAIEQEWLVNEETRKGHPAKYKLGESVPPEEGLPTVDELRGNTVSDNNIQPVTVAELKNNSSNTVTTKEQRFDQEWIGDKTKKRLNGEN